MINENEEKMKFRRVVCYSRMNIELKEFSFEILNDLQKQQVGENQPLETTLDIRLSNLEFEKKGLVGKLLDLNHLKENTKDDYDFVEEHETNPEKQAYLRAFLDTQHREEDMAVLECLFESMHDQDHKT